MDRILRDIHLVMMQNGPDGHPKSSNKNWACREPCIPIQQTYEFPWGQGEFVGLAD